MFWYSRKKRFLFYERERFPLLLCEKWFSSRPFIVDDFPNSLLGFTDLRLRLDYCTIHSDQLITVRFHWKCLLFYCFVRRIYYSTATHKLRSEVPTSFLLPWRISFTDKRCDNSAYNSSHASSCNVSNQSEVSSFRSIISEHFQLFFSAEICASKWMLALFSSVPECSSLIIRSMISFLTKVAEIVFILIKV